MRIESKTVRLRLVEPDDASFILSLRLDPKYNRFLSEVTNDVDAQRRWIERYKQDERDRTQFYFIIERLDDGSRCGTVRLYDFRQDSFCWGSWILLEENKTKTAALESTLMVYDVGFDELGFAKSHFDVRKGNEKVVKYHERMGAVRVSEDDENFYFEITKDAVDQVRVDFEKVIHKEPRKG
ncbi:GNAT family N-acetyltransferase [Pseudomonas sp. UFMG81]|uniref:GNAT family N-acetyltransferase n=1 Tax=Pseudomonas sp. UFMG81 TaxID=2745936 RepID=UPI00188F7130|nr:GNAT family N-acetyltransferase [Pseudomonas sp. UFMG81]